MNVSAFLRGGPLTDIMWRVLNYRDFGDMLKDRHISEHQLDEFLKLYKKKKIVITHLGHIKKLREFGPAANDNATVFEYDHNGTLLRLSVDQYFSLRSKSDPKYPILKYPSLPTVSNKHLFLLYDTRRQVVNLIISLD